MDADGDRLLAEHRRRRQEGARLGRPARARARRDRRRRRLEGHQGRHQPDRLAAARRHAVHADRARRCTTARPTRRRCRGARSSTRRSCPSGDKLQWSGSGNDFGCPPNGGHNLDIALPALADVPAGTPVTLLVQVPLGHRVGLRLRLRAHVDRQRQELPVARVGERLHDARLAEPERQRLPAGLRQRPHGLQRLLSRPAPQTVDRVRGQLSGRAVRRRRVRPLGARRQGVRAAALLRDRPGTRAAGLVRRRPAGQGRRPRHLLVGLRVRRPTRRSTTAAAARASRPPSSARTAGSRSRPPTARRPSTRT